MSEILRNPRLAELAWFGGLTIYFLLFQAPSLNCVFGGDDMMNTAYYWTRGAAPLVTGLIAFWSDYYRPMGGLFYLPLYSLFGLNPVPYRVCELLLVAATLVFVFKSARRLSGSLQIAGLTTLVCAYHGPMSELYFYTFFVYDVLCNLFYFAALSLYLAVRSQGRLLSNGRMAAVGIAYICALNSKEIAVTLPVALLAYEMLFHTPKWSEIRKAPLGQLRPVLALAVITLLYVLGKTGGSQALSKQSGYVPVVSIPAFLMAKHHYLTTLFDRPHWLTPPASLTLYTLLLAIAIWLRKPLLGWCWLMMLVTTLPIDFIPLRGGAMIFLLLFPAALFLMTLLTGIADWVAGHVAWRRAVAVLCLIPFLWTLYLWNSNFFRFHFAAIRNDRDVIYMIHNVQSLGLRIPPKSKVMLMSSPWASYNLYFVAALCWNDRSLEIHENGKGIPQLSLEEARDKYDYVLAYQKDRLVVLKPDQKGL